MRVVAIVVAWNAARDLPACLDALDAQDHDDLEIVVVDNASRDGTADLLRAAAGTPRRHELRVVTNATNRGFCGGVNDAMATLPSHVDAVLLVNPDAIAAPSLVRRAAGVLRADATVGSVQPRLTRPAAVSGGRSAAAGRIDTTGHVLTSARLVRNRGEGEPAERHHPPAGEVFGASGALVLHRREMLEDVAWRDADGRPEYLTEDLFAYFDDVELDWRARLLGWRTWYEPAATGIHERGGAGPRRTDRVEALNWSNRLLVLVTCDDPRALLGHVPVVVATTLLKTLELMLTVPRGALAALARLRLLPAARRRRQQLRSRARRPFGEVPARFAEPFRWRPWIAAWWDRTRSRG